MVNCIFHHDASSDSRFLGCNNRNVDIKDGIAKDFRKEVQALWDAKKSMNICKLEGILSQEDYLSNSWKNCALSGSGQDFNWMTQTYQLLAPSRPTDDFMWNEVVLRILGDRTSSYRKSIAAFFYLSSSTDDYYATPTGELKKYNIHLGHAQKQQQMAKDTGLFIPIIEIDMDSVKNGGSPFRFHLEDQVVKA